MFKTVEEDNNLSYIANNIYETIYQNFFSNIEDLTKKYDNKEISNSDLILNISILSNNMLKHLNKDRSFRNNANKVKLNKEYNLRDDWLMRLIKETIFKFISKRYDLHMGNIGYSNMGYFNYFDSSRL